MTASRRTRRRAQEPEQLRSVRAQLDTLKQDVTRFKRLTREILCNVAARLERGEISAVDAVGELRRVATSNAFDD